MNGTNFLVLGLLVGLCLAQCPLGQVNRTGICEVCPAGQTNNEDQTSCVDCPPGFYSQSDAICRPCAPGTVSPNPGSTTCDPCAAGFGLSPNGTECFACPAGQYSQFSQACRSCPSGSVSIPGSSVCEDCTSPYGANGNSSGCILCPPGRTSSGGRCLTCSEGYFNAVPGSTCQRCPYGWTSDENRTSCVACDPNYGGLNCKQCGVYDRTYGNTPNTWSISGSSCLYCPSGTIALRDGGCAPTPAGWHGDNRLADRCYEGWEITTTYQPDPSQTDCLPCPARTHPSYNRTTCVTCPEGYYWNYVYVGYGCKPCYSSSVCPGDDRSYTCSAGKTSNGNRTQCVPCTPGSYETTNNGRCALCPIGKYSLGGTTSCLTCPEGTQSTADRTGCVAEGEDLGCDKLSIVVDGECTPCPIDHVADPTHTQCVRCPDGEVATTAGCHFCPTGRMEQNGTCVSCPSKLVVSANRTACEPCPLHTRFYVDTCVECPYYSYVSNNNCVRCPSMSVVDPDAERCIPLTCEPPQVPVLTIQNTPICYDPTPKCPDGQEVSVGGNCRNCSRNWYSQASVNFGNCVPCPVGSDTNGTVGARECSPCPEGTGTQGRADSCSPCDRGEFRNSSTNQLCAACPRGQTSDGGATCFSCPPGRSGDVCYPCSPGYVTNAMGICIACPPGTSSNTNRTQCLPCSPGYAGSGGDYCRKCRTGYISPGGASFCTACPPNYAAIKDNTECVPCTCALCSGGPSGCTNPSAQNWRAGSIIDNGSCVYAKSQFVVDLVGCSLTTLQSSGSSFTFPSFGNTEGLVASAMEVSVAVKLDDTSLASIRLLGPDGFEVSLLAPGSLNHSSCTLNLVFTPYNDTVSLSLNETCEAQPYEPNCSYLSQSGIYMPELFVADINPAGEWRLQISGTSGKLHRSQIALMEYVQTRSSFRQAEDNVYLSCVMTSNDTLELMVATSFGTTLSVGDVIAGMLCDTFVARIDSVVPSGSDYLVQGHLVGLDQVYAQLSLKSLSPTPSQARALSLAVDGSISANYNEIPYLSLSSTISSSLSASLDISINLSGLKSLSLLLTGALDMNVGATLTIEESVSSSEEVVLASAVLGQGVIMLPLGVPLPYRAEGELVLRQSAEASASIRGSLIGSGSAQASVGFKYTSERGMEGVNELDASFDANFDTSLGCSLTASIGCGPRLSMTLGRRGVLSAPFSISAITYVEQKVSQSLSNTECCGDTSLESRTSWGIRSDLSAALEVIGYMERPISTHFAAGNDLMLTCAPSIPEICSTVPCTSLPPPPPPISRVVEQPLQSPAGRQSQIFGDPHMRSQDGCAFSYQGAGEFLLLEGKEDDNLAPFIVQGLFTGSGVTRLRALAIGDGATTFSMGAPSSSSLLFYNDNSLNLVEGCVFAFPGGRVKVVRGSYRFDYDRGYSISVSPRTGSLSIGLPISSFGKVKGMLGSYDDNPSNHFVGRNGTLYGLCDGDRQSTSCDAVNSWADTWALVPEESLLLYAPGEPRPQFRKSQYSNSACARPLFASELAQSTAEAVCEILRSNNEIYNACLFDVATTGSSDLLPGAVDAFSESLLDGLLVRDLAIQFNSSSDEQLMISYRPPLDPPTDLANSTIRYELSFRRITSNTTYLLPTQPWTDLESTLLTQTVLVLPRSESTAIELRARAVYESTGGSTSWVAIRVCVPECEAEYCCGTCTLYPCLECPSPDSPCISPPSECDLGYYDRQKLQYLIDCAECPPNTYSSSVRSDNSRCEICPSGTTTNGLTARTQEIDCGCPSGQGALTGTDAIGCQLCPVDTYSSGFTLGLVPCSPCPTGSTNGSLGAEACGCPAGSASPSIDNPQCASCGNQVSPDFTTFGSSCQNCPAGYESDNLSITCVSCKAGQTSMEGGRCYNCAAGMSSVEGGPCEECDAGSSSLAGGLCETCSAGESSIAGGACIGCPAGQSSVAGGSCQPCEAGETSLRGGLCEPCPRGTSSAAGDSECTECPEGFIAPMPGQLCEPCPPGTETTDGVSCDSCPQEVCGCVRGQFIADGRCQDCPSHQISEPPFTQCFSCPDGQQGVNGVCRNCTSGEESVDGLCQPCPINTYSQEGGSCQPCPAGRYSPERSQQCIVCENGTTSESGQSCLPCEPGTYSTQGDICKECVPGTFALAGASSCQECPENSVSSVAGASNCTDCTLSDMIANESRTECILPSPSSSPSQSLSPSASSSSSSSVTASSSSTSSTSPSSTSSVSLSMSQSASPSISPSASLSASASASVSHSRSSGLSFTPTSSHSPSPSASISRSISESSTPSSIVPVPSSSASASLNLPSQSATTSKASDTPSISPLPATPTPSPSISQSAAPSRISSSPANSASNTPIASSSQRGQVQTSPASSRSPTSSPNPVEQIVQPAGSNAAEVLVQLGCAPCLDNTAERFIRQLEMEMNRQSKSVEVASVRMVAYAQSEGLMELLICDSTNIAQLLQSIDDGLISGFNGAQVHNYYWMIDCPDNILSHSSFVDSSSDGCSLTCGGALLLLVLFVFSLFGEW